MNNPKKTYPLFTIVTITRNNYGGLQKTFKSLEKQTFKDYQWLVIDGASTDETLQFLKKRRSETRMDQFPFSFFSEHDEGIYDAMNIGIEHANGRFLLFLNAGDELASDDILEKLSPYAAKKPDFIYGDALEPVKGQPQAAYKHARRYKELKWGMITHHQAMLYNRYTVRDFKIRYSLLYDIASDYDFTARFLLKAKKILYIPTPICIFEQGGVSQKNARLGRKEQFIIREKLRMVGQVENLWILTVQSLSWALFRLSPSLYRLLKSSVRKPQSIAKAKTDAKS